MFKNLKGIKFEKINMKMVIAIGIGIILILTAIFILFRTNLIIDRSGNKKDPDNSQNGGNNNGGDTEDPDGNNGGDKKDPDYEDPDDETPNNSNGISEEAKNRTKTAERLNEEEKKYIMEENMVWDLTNDKEVYNENKDICSKETCNAQATSYLWYDLNGKYGAKIQGCTGEITFIFDEKQNKFVFDFSKVTCK